MKRPIRRTLYRYLTFASLLSAVIASGSLWAVGELTYREYYRRLEAEGFQHVRDRLVLFDTILARVERDACAAGREALIAFARRYRTSAGLAGASVDGLKAEALSLGVDDVYFIGRDGRVVASSYSADIGLDLFSLGPQFREGLKSLFGSGITADQRATQSTATGIVTVYQYYGPAGSDVLIEVSTRISAQFTRYFGGKSYDELIKRAFSADVASSGEKASIRMVDLLGESGDTLWSLIEEGERRNEYASLVAMKDAGRSARTRKAGIETVLFSVPLESRSSPVVHNRRFAVVEIDLRPLIRFRTLTLAVLVLACATAVAASILLVRRKLGRTLAGRVEQLESALARSASNGEAFDFTDWAEDEITSIARNVSALVADLRSQAVDLRASLSEQVVLQREIHHRVKNNLQIILSLVGLQIDVERDPAVTKALSATRTRLYAISLVLDRLYATPSVERLALDEFLRDFCLYMSGAFRRSDVRVEIETDGGGLFLSPDAAVPVGLLLEEVISNSLSHGFPGRERGKITVRAAAVGHGFRLTVSDDGVGGDLAYERVGMAVIRALSAQLGSVPLIVVDGGRTIELDLPPDVFIVLGEAAEAKS
jgi:two-component sensor histidine kinase